MQEFLLKLVTGMIGCGELTEAGTPLLVSYCKQPAFICITLLQHRLG